MVRASYRPHGCTPWLVGRNITGGVAPGGPAAGTADRAAVRRHELAAFRRGLDLLATPGAAQAWRALEHLSVRLDRSRGTRAAPATSPPTSTPS